MIDELVVATEEFNDQCLRIKSLVKVADVCGYNTVVDDPCLIQLLNIESSEEGLSSLIYKGLVAIGKTIHKIFKIIFKLIRKLSGWINQKRIERGILSSTLKDESGKVNKNLDKSIGVVAPYKDIDDYLNTLDRLQSFLFTTSSELGNNPSSPLVTSLSTINVTLSPNWEISTPPAGVLKVVDTKKPLKPAVDLGWTNADTISETVVRAEEAINKVDVIDREMSILEKVVSSRIKEGMEVLKKTTNDQTTVTQVNELQKYVLATSKLTGIYTTTAIATYSHLETFAVSLLK